MRNSGVEGGIENREEILEGKVGRELDADSEGKWKNSTEIILGKCRETVEAVDQLLFQK